jgi:hypothetical protein
MFSHNSFIDSLITTTLLSRCSHIHVVEKNFIIIIIIIIIIVIIIIIIVIIIIITIIIIKILLSIERVHKSVGKSHSTKLAN